MLDATDKDVEGVVVLDAAAADMDVDPPHQGKSSWWMAAGHILTVFLGPGILAMPYIMSRLGWVASLAGLLLFFCLTLWTSGLLAEVYEVDGKRHGRYDAAVRSILGPRHGLFLTASQHINLVLANIGFQIAAADACCTIARTLCRANGTPEGSCWANRPVLTVAVGGVQLLLSQMRDLQAARVTSAAGGVAAVVYCGITFALAASQVGNKQGTVSGHQAPTAAKVFSAFNALGAIGFGLNAPIITLEVTDTLRQPPAAAASMKKSLRLGLGSCVVLFAVGGVLGYLALGDAVEGFSFLLAFQNSAPAWVLVLGSLMVVLNMVPAYQVCCQPSFAAFQAVLLNSRCISSKAMSRGSINQPGADPPSHSKQNSCSLNKAWFASLAFRSAYIAFTTLVAVALPFFAVILGLVAASTFYQTAVLYPVLLHRTVYPRTRLGTLLTNTVLLVAAAVIGLVVVGSVAVIVMSASRLSPFKAL